MSFLDDTAESNYKVVESNKACREWNRVNYTLTDERRKRIGSVTDRLTFKIRENIEKGMPEADVEMIVPNDVVDTLMLFVKCISFRAELIESSEHTSTIKIRIGQQ